VAIVLIITSYHHITHLKRQNRLKVGTNSECVKHR